MNIASRAVAKELWDLSHWVCNPDDDYMYNYDLGFLLRKQPMIIEPGDDGTWLAAHITDIVSALANTPEDAACKLICELIRLEVIHV